MINTYDNLQERKVTQDEMASQVSQCANYKVLHERIKLNNHVYSNLELLLCLPPNIMQDKKVIQVYEVLEVTVGKKVIQETME